MDFGDAGDRFADILGEAAHFLDPGFAKRDHPLLQFRNNVDLQRIKCCRGKAEKDILGEYEAQIDQQQAAEIERCRRRRADIPADRLNLGSDHRNDLALGDFFEMRQRKAKDARIQHVAQPAQHLLAQPAGIDVQHKFYAAAEDDKKQEAQAEHHQKGDLLHLGAENVARPAVPRPDRLIDDRLGQLQRQIDDRPGDESQRQHHQLLAFAVFHDEAEDAPLQRHVRLIAGSFGARHPAPTGGLRLRTRHQATRPAADAAE